MNKILLNGILMALTIVMIVSCQYKFTVEPAPPPPPPPGDTTSFSLEVVPIWSEQGCTGCHSTGSTAPDLTPENAYNSITSMGLVNIDVPSESRIYYYPLPGGSHFAKYSVAQAATVLYWIEEGAKDN